MALETPDRRAELPPCRRIRARAAHRELRHADIGRRQRNRAPGGEAFHQHAPAVAHLFPSADDPFHRNEHVFAPVRAVLERGVERPVMPSDVHARMRRRNERAGDAGRVGIAEKMVGIERAEREAEHRRNGPKRDVALVPGHAKAERFAAFMHAFTDDADIGNPAYGLVSAKQEISSPRARRGR